MSKKSSIFAPKFVIGDEVMRLIGDKVMRLMGDGLLAIGNGRWAMRGLLLMLCVCAFCACNTTKFVPQGQYLLNNVHIKVDDTKDVSSADLMKYVQQQKMENLMHHL